MFNHAVLFEAVAAAIPDRECIVQGERRVTYAEMSELTPMASPFVSGEARHNRAEITAVMRRHASGGARLTSAI